MIGIVALGIAGAATAQENLNAGKTPAQLYAADCAICHKTMRGMTKAGGFFGLESYLRLHYTSSRESAAAIAAYIRKTDTGPLPPQHERAGRHRRTGAVKTGSAKPTQNKPAQKKAAAKPASQKPAAKQVGEAKPAGQQPDQKAKAAAAKMAKPKATDAEAKALKPKPGAKEAKPD